MPALKHADLELLSAYLDDALPPEDRAALERRLAAEPDLRAELAALRAVVDRVRALPTLTAPRDFRLDPAVYGKQVQASRVTVGRTAARAYYRWGSALSAVAAAIMLVIGVLGLVGPQFNAPQSAALLQEAADSAADGAAQRSVTQVAVLPTPSPAPTLGITVIPLDQAGRGAGPEAGGFGGAEEPVEGDAVQAEALAAEAEEYAADTLEGQTAVEAPSADAAMEDSMPAGAPGMGGGGTPPSGESGAPPVALSAPGVEDYAEAEALPAEESESVGEMAADTANATGQIAAQLPATKSGLPTAMLPVTEVALLPTAPPQPTLPPPVVAESAPADESPTEDDSAAGLYAIEDDTLRIDPGIFLGASVVLLALAAALFALSKRR